jgi:hypothetical protein
MDGLVEGARGRDGGVWAAPCAHCWSAWASPASCVSGNFFTVNIHNANTRAAYDRAAGSFLRWCEDLVVFLSGHAGSSFGFRLVWCFNSAGNL